MEIDDTVPPASGPILVTPMRNNARATKGRIDPLPDALDPGGNQCTPLVGRAVVIGASGATVAEPSASVDFGLAQVAGDRVKQTIVTTSTSLTDAHCGHFIVVSSSSDVTLTVDLADVSIGWQCAVYRAGTGEVAIATTGGLTLRETDGYTRIDRRYDTITLLRVAGGNDLLATGRMKP